MVMCPIVVSAFAPCQWRSPALMCTTSPTLISRRSCSVATVPEPEVTINTWSQLWVMPSRGAALAEVHDAAVIVGRVSRVNDRLARPGNRACVPFDRLRTFHWDLGYIFERD